jgi:uncharacterized protein YqeY
MSDGDEIRSYPPEHNRSLKGILKKYVKRSISAEEFEEVCERAWAEAAAENWKRKFGDR